MQMNRLFLISTLILVSLLFASCKKEDIKKKAPSLSSEQLFMDKDNNFYDTIKLDYKRMKHYPLHIEDDGDLDILLKIENFSSNFAEIAINGEIQTEIISNTYVKNDKLDVIVLFKEDKRNILMPSKFSLQLEDRVGQKSPVYTFVSAGFDKLPPIATFSLKKIALISTYEYEIDASGSYDQDRKYGGRIVQYIYKIDNKVTRISKNNKLRYSFPGEGTYQVSLIVRDNDGLSALTQKTLVVKKEQ